MNADLHCLSILELLELPAGETPGEAGRHLATCPRCQALLRHLPTNLLPALTQLQPARETPPHAGTVRALPATSRVGTGALWRAVSSPEADVAWVVVIIGRSPDSKDRLLVAPVASPSENATDRDLLLDRDILGYSAFLDMTNLGSLLRSQLLEPIGELNSPLAEAMVELYRHLLVGAPVPEKAPRGLPVLDEADPRLLEEAVRAEALRELWRPAHALVDKAGELNKEAATEAASPSGANETTLSQLLLRYIEGPDAEWDRTTLLEAAHADGGRLGGFLVDRLDLTDTSDVPDLARVLHVLGVSWADAQPVVRASLQKSAGGVRQAEGPSVPMAARSRSGADADQTTKDLYADRSSVDTSEEARAKAIGSYLAELQGELEELE